MNRQQLLMSGVGHLVGGLVGFAIVMAASLWRPTSWGGWLAVGLIVLAGAELGSIVATRIIRKKPASI